MTRRASKVDSNQSEIVDALRAAGCSVLDLSGVGKGMPDICAAKDGINYLMEIKNPKTYGKLSKRQIEWHDTWRGQVAIVRSVDEALRVIGVV
jgi:Holliday junction resolvase